MDAAGNIFVADSIDLIILKFAPGGGPYTVVAGSGNMGSGGDGGPATAASFSGVGSLAVDSSGNLFILDSDGFGAGYACRIRKVSAVASIITTVAGGPCGFSGDGGPATGAQFNASTITVDAVGNLFIADAGGNNRIRKVSAATGIITTVAGSGAYGTSGDGGPATTASLAAPQGVAVDASGDLFISEDEYTNLIRKVSVSGIITTVAGNGSCSYSGDGGPATAAALCVPEALAVDTSGNLFIADVRNYRIRKVSASPSTTLPAPVISGLSPNSATAGGSAFTLTVNGSGFVNGSVVEWNGLAVATSYISANQLTASITASLIASQGSISVTVLNAGASASNAVAFNIHPPAPAAPVISSLSPNSATSGGAAFKLTVYGSGFSIGSNVDRWNGSWRLRPSYVSATQVTATIPASLIASAGALRERHGAEHRHRRPRTPPCSKSSSFRRLLTCTTISHIADGGGWRSSIILVNTDVVPALYAVNLWNDAGASYAPPLALGTATGSIAVGGSTIIETADTASALAEGWAEVTSNQSIGGTAIFRYDPWSQEAAVPLLTSGGVKLEIPYQVGSGLSLGVALANPSATQSASLTEVIRGQNGNQLASRTLTLSALNHTSFNPTFPSTVAGGGVVEYKLERESIRTRHPQRSRSAVRTGGSTSLDAVLPLAASTKTISHIADGGGWRSSIILVNTDTVPASYTVSFLNDSGASYVPPLALGKATGSIPVGGSTIIETADAASTLTSGWAQVTSSQAVGGTAIFRYDPWSQEAAVPLLTSGGVKLEIPYQVGTGLTLGIALANPSATQTANITEIIRDQNGNQLASRALTLAPLNHTSFNPTFPSTVAGGGVVEYDSNVNLFGLGIRSAPEGALIWHLPRSARATS